MSEEEKNEEEEFEIEDEDSEISSPDLDEGETDLETILDIVFRHEDSNQRGKALLRLEELVPDLNLEDLIFSIEVLGKARKKEEVGKVIGKMDEVNLELWKNRRIRQFDENEKYQEIKIQEQAKERLESYAGPVDENDHLANLRALPVIEEHLYWISLFARISIILTIIYVIFWIIVFYGAYRL